MATKKERTIAEDATLSQPLIEAHLSADLQRLVHELEVHQLELETQNEELRSARLEAESAQRQYQELFESAPAGYLMLDTRGVIVKANVAACELLRQRRHRLVGEPLIVHVVHTEQARFEAHIDCVRVGGHDQCEVYLKGPENTQCLTRLDTKAMPSDASQYLVVLTDMSERQRNHEALAALNRKLAAQNRRLQTEALARALSEGRRRELERRLREAERLQSLGMLAAGVAHDFKNLLLGMVGHAELLLKMPELPETCRDGLAMIRRTCQDASELTRQLLVMAGCARMEKSAVSLSAVVTECVELLRPRLGEAVRVDLQFARELPPINADRAHIQRVVMNLVNNALEAMEGRGEILLRVSQTQLDAEQLAQFQHADAARPGEFALLHLADTGPGIAPANIARIFDPFFTTKFTGRGLGLAIALGVVRSHGGAIRVHSHLGLGTSFEVAIPICAPRPVLLISEYSDKTMATHGGRVVQAPMPAAPLAAAAGLTSSEPDECEARAV